jgi:prophage tail gpP-like protein
VKVHIVQSGDTLNAIARRYRLNVNAIFNASSFRSGDRNLIYPGESAIIPDDGDSPVNQDLDFYDGDENEVRIKVNGTEFTGWSGVTIEVSLDGVARAFSITSAFDPSNSTLNASISPFSYSEVTIYIGSTLVLTGQIEVIQASISDSESAINIQGRSKTGVLLDCSIPVDQLTYTGLTLQQIANSFCQTFGIPVQLNGSDTTSVSDARAKPGDKYFDFLKSIADAKARILRDDERGRLVIDNRPSGTGAPVQSFIEGEGQFVAFSATYDGTQRFSRYKVLLQVKGFPEVSSEVFDTSIQTPRPSVVIEKEAEFNDARPAAEWERARAFARAGKFSMPVIGWRREDGQLWRPGEIITVQSPSCFLNNETRFLVTSVSYSLTAGERSVNLDLHLPETYTGSLPVVFPWE